MKKNFWRNWKMAAASRYHQVTNVKRAAKNARRLFLAMLWSLSAVVCLTACRTTTATQREHQTHTVEADTLSKQARQESERHQSQEDIDSIVTARVWAAMQEYVSQEQERERTTEHTETTQHADGSVTTTTDRTTDRTIDRREQQRTEQTLRQMETDFHRQIVSLDSTWQSRFNEYQIHLYDSVAQASEKHKASEPAATPRSFWQDVKQVTLIAALLLLLILLVRYRDRLPGMH